MPDIKLGSLFDGIGVFPLAASRCGIRPVWASEIEKAPISITKRHFPDMAHLGDITKVDGGKIPPVHVITFGSPCQNLSLIGNRSGLAGAKSSLFYQAFRIIQEMRDATDNLYPAIAVWENVMGAFSTNDRMDFRAVLSAFSDTEVPMPPSRTIDTILNIILFVPLGFFLPLLYKKYHHMKTVALTGFLFSLAVEIVQMFGWGSSDINDLMTNTAGACIGFLVYCLLSRILPANLKKQLQSSRVNAVAEVLLFAICTFAIMVTAQTWFVHDVLNVP
ncbi:DNA cytosine methyltransferase [Coprococcus comes]|uniref:DNA cytosine methyltransferase n=1 Tax=Coprococcus comes TaxID=410072 RepID=UPI001FAD88E9|nr:VanZ family protein [Coprococcus comes]MDB1812379.1 DNA cytosine methyltransferase [Coprococcus comes]MDB1815597.1 DNA cytosine methyltransferase [Coprococcus comes]